MNKNSTGRSDFANNNRAVGGSFPARQTMATYEAKCK